MVNISFSFNTKCINLLKISCLYANSVIAKCIFQESQNRERFLVISVDGGHLGRRDRRI